MMRVFDAVRVRVCVKGGHVLLGEGIHGAIMLDITIVLKLYDITIVLKL